MATMLGKYFSLEEFTRSDNAKAWGIDNAPSEADIKRMKLLVKNVLDPLREAFGSAIFVSSGYRSKALNAAMIEHGQNASATSDHCFGQAADLQVYKTDNGKRVKDKGANQRLFELCISLGLPYKQLIDEYGFSWVHVSFQAGSTKHEVKHIR